MIVQMSGLLEIFSVQRSISVHLKPISSGKASTVQFSLHNH